MIPVVLLASMAAAAATTTAPGSSQPATWRPYNLIVDLHALPVRYSCDDLWYKFHDVLLALGARPDLQILAYRCEPGLSDLASRSPRVQLRFDLPEAPDKSQSRWADLAGGQTAAGGTGQSIAVESPLRCSS